MIASQNKNSPLVSFIILIGITLVSTLVVQATALFFGVLFSGNPKEAVENMGELNNLSESPAFMYLLLASGSVGTFLLPAFFLQKLESYNTYFPAQKSNVIVCCVIAGVFLFAFGPLMQLIGELNMNMKLPDSLKDLQNWMRVKEDEMALLTERIAMTDQYSTLLMNIIVLAVLPAIAEEFYFRGSLMQILSRSIKNQHLVIWITAIIFSAIHVQFFGFFPRMILGVFFGYMLQWTQNIWVPVFAHFVNNATVTILAFWYTKQGKNFSDLQSYEDYSIIVYLGSFILTTGIAWWSYKKLHHRNGKRLDENSNI